MPIVLKCVYAVTFPAFLWASNYQLEKETVDSWLFILVACLSVSSLIVIVVVSMLRIRSWHGAEHKAITAYEELGKTSLRHSRKASSIQPKCGGRLALPFILSAWVSSIVAPHTGYGTIVCQLIGVEVVLWIDRLIGWERIPFFSHASILLQKWVTTKDPGEKELRTAKVTLEALIDAHDRG